MWVSDTYTEPYSCSDIIPIVIGGVVAVVIVLLGSIANYVIWKRNNGKNSSFVIFLLKYFMHDTVPFDHWSD